MFVVRYVEVAEERLADIAIRGRHTHVVPPTNSMSATHAECVITPLCNCQRGDVEELFQHSPNETKLPDASERTFATDPPDALENSEPFATNVPEEMPFDLWCEGFSAIDEVQVISAGPSPPRPPPRLIGEHFSCVSWAARDTRATFALPCPRDHGITTQCSHPHLWPRSHAGM